MSGAQAQLGSAAKQGKPSKYRQFVKRMHRRWFRRECKRNPEGAPTKRIYRYYD
ncbi:hypothetical protein KS4_23270 [Poriferisphaera corsica]|uniref:Uncharacterized protein n=1 Tax=Poriferisphaera corsica TaxID=2528020 RepID=A0A517YVJ4_9BACT|nr:hypothetical protein KS4_23270 [Poriferisphaera corsica]